MSVYLDYGGTAYQSYPGNNTNTLTATANYPLSTGPHTLILNAWDSTGQIYQSAVPFTVSSTGVVINSPAANSTVSSPVNFSATAAFNGQPVSAMDVYLVSIRPPLAVTVETELQPLQKIFPTLIATGSHIIIVNAWDSKGQIYQSAVSFTVQKTN
jgi:hypothetical protein